MLSDRVPEVEKTAFIDDRTLDAAELPQLTKAIEEVVEMDALMGHQTNIEKSKMLATTKRTRKKAGELKIKGLQIQLVQDFKLLGHRCIGVRKYITTDAEEAAQEARLRVNRIEHLPIPQESKVNLIKASAMTVAAASTQWSRPLLATLERLKNETLRAVWGTKRQMRCSEVVSAIINDATEIDPIRASAWNALANARRLMKKDPKVEKHVVKICQLRDSRIAKAEKAIEENHKEKVIPNRRLSKKTKAEEVERRQNSEAIGQAQKARREGEQNGREIRRVLAKAGTDRTTPIEVAEGADGGRASTIAKAANKSDKEEEVQLDSAQADTDRTENSEEDYFAPAYHPEAASSDGRRRTWKQIGKSAVLIFPEEGEQRENQDAAANVAEQPEAKRRSRKDSSMYQGQLEVFASKLKWQALNCRLAKKESWSSGGKEGVQYP